MQAEARGMLIGGAEFALVKFARGRHRFNGKQTTQVAGPVVVDAVLIQIVVPEVLLGGGGALQRGAGRLLIGSPTDRDEPDQTDREKDRNDGDHDHQLDEGESAAYLLMLHFGSGHDI